MEHVDPLFGIILPYINFFIFLGSSDLFLPKTWPQSHGRRKAKAFAKLMAEARAG